MVGVGRAVFPRVMVACSFLACLAGCGARSIVPAGTSAISSAARALRSPQVVQVGNAASLQTLQIPSGTLGIVNGTDEAVYALLSGGTSIYRRPMINGSASTYPLGATAYPHSLARGPFTLNTFWFTQRRGAGQSDGVDAIASNGTVTRYTSPVAYPNSIVTARDNAHMYVTGSSCLCRSAAIQIGVMNLDGSGQAAYTVPLPANASAQLYDGITLGPDDHIIWFPIRVTTTTSDRDELVGFNTTTTTFVQLPLPNNHAIYGIVEFNSALAVAEAPDALELVRTTNGNVTPVTLPEGATQPIYPIVDSTGTLWVSAIGADGSHGVLVELSPAGTSTAFDTPAAANGSLTVGPDANIWFGSSDPHLYVEVVHALAVTPASIALDVGGQQTITATEANPAGVLTARSYDTKVATVSGSGSTFTVTAVGPGTTQVTVIDQQENVVSIPVSVTQVATYAYTGAAATFTVPVTGTYTIVAAGAQGGGGSPGTPIPGAPAVGGLGATIGGTFVLPINDQLRIDVGGEGSSQGGGGGSFVYDLTTRTLLVAAGGGGGGGKFGYDTNYNDFFGTINPWYPGGNGLSTTSGGGPSNVAADGVIGGTGGAGGPGVQNSFASGGGGGGYDSAGTGDFYYCYIFCGFYTAAGGGAYPGLAGGSPGGGFGGGGASYGAGGGGGGYSGGAGGSAIGGISDGLGSSGGGGGGSYLAPTATNPSLQSGQQSGNGLVSITGPE